MRKRKSQDYSPEEFEAVVALLQRDAKARKDIEVITGQKLSGKSAREIFDLWRSVQTAAEVKVAFAAYGKASLVLSETRREIEQTAETEEALKLARAEIKRLEGANASLRRDINAQQRQIENVTALPARAVYAEGTGQ